MENTQAPPKQSLALSTATALQTLMDDKGQIDLSSIDPITRIQQFIDFREKHQMNLPLWEQSMMAQFPAGSTAIPVPVVATKQDAWRGQDARKMQLKEGYVEPSADFILRLGNAAGVQLREIFSGPVDIDGVKMYSVRYNAYLTMPNGEILTVENEGKDQAMYTDRGMQSHIVESTRKKAKRNAVKAILGIPTSMSETDFDRPWVVLRPLFRSGVSAETDAIISKQEKIAEESMDRLFNRPQAAQTQTIGKPEELKVRIESCQTADDLRIIGKYIQGLALTAAARNELGALYKRRLAYLEDGEIVDVKTEEKPATEVEGEQCEY